jgi:chromosome segregation ATPase
MDKKDREEIKEIVKEETKHLATRDEMLAAFERQDQKMLAMFDRQSEMIQGEFKKINQRFDSFEARVAKLEERVTRVEERLGIMSRQLENLSDAIAELRADRKHDVTYVASLEEKMLAERADTQSEYQTLAAKLNELETRISKLESKPNG